MDRNKVNLIDGTIWKSILLFSFPLLVGNCFQQLYNTVDSYVVGNYVGVNALAAVGASSPVINMLIGLFMGLSAGAGVVLARYYGAKDDEGITKTIHTAIALTIVMSLFLAILGQLSCDYILKAINVPEDIIDQSSIYLGVYFLGVPFTLFYNIGAGILRAMGDSKRPLYFLILSSFLNMSFDIIFVKYFGLGIAGVAYATMGAQAISATLVLSMLLRLPENQRLVIKKIRFTKFYLKKIIILGLPSAIQQSVVSFSNVIVQSYVNGFGSTVVAGYSSQMRIDGFVFLPLGSFSMAVTTFVGQNIGAQKFDRVKKGAYTTIFMAFCVIAVMSTGLYFFGEQLLGLFSNDVDVIAVGRVFQMTVIPFYVVLAFCQVSAGVMNGAGKSIYSMTITVSNFVFMRQLYLMFITNCTSDIKFIFAAWPVTWITCSIIYTYFLVKGSWLNDAMKQNWNKFETKNS